MKTDLTQTVSLKPGFSTIQKFRLLVVFALYLLVGLNSGGFGVILPAFSATYQLDKSATSQLFLALTVGYLISALFSSWLAARFGFHRFVMFGMFLFIAGSLTLGLKPPFVAAWVARGVVGFAAGIMEMGGNFYVAALPRNTALLNYLHAFFGAGALGGPLLATWVLENQLGWNSLYLIWLVLGILVTLGFNLAFRHLDLPAHGTENHTPSASETSEIKKPMLTAIKVPAMWLATIFLLVYVGVETTVGSWSYTFLTEGPHFSPALAGGLVSLYWGGLTLGRFVLGAVIGRLHSASTDRIVLIGCIIVSILGAALVWLGQEQALLSGAGLFLIGFSYGPIYPTTLALLSRLVAPGLISSSISLITGLSILGVSIFPSIAGSLLETWGQGVLFPYIIVLAGLMLVLGAILLRPPDKKALA